MEECGDPPRQIGINENALVVEQISTVNTMDRIEVGVLHLEDTLKQLECEYEILRFDGEFVNECVRNNCAKKFVCSFQFSQVNEEYFKYMKDIWEFTEKTAEEYLKETKPKKIILVSDCVVHPGIVSNLHVATYSMYVIDEDRMTHTAQFYLQKIRHVIPRYP